MPGWHEALRTYRRRSLAQHDGPGASVMFVLCSESHAEAALAASCEPAIVLQALGGARTPSDPSTRATFDYAVAACGVRHVVVCGHARCRALDAGAHDARDPRAASQAHVVAQCRRLRQDPHIGPLLRDHGVMLRALWFDEPEGDIYACDLEGRGATLLGDVELTQLRASFDARPG